MKSANQELGGLKVKELKPYHVTDWLNKMRAGKEVTVTVPGRKPYQRFCKWNATTCKIAADMLFVALNWAKRQKLITAVPLEKRDLELKAKRVRSKDYLVSEDEHKAMMEGAKRNLADLLAVLHGTGARPGEVYNATAANYDPNPEAPALIHRGRPEEGQYRWKNAKEEREDPKDRVILLTPELNAIVARLVLKYPEGPLFRNRDGGKWTPQGLYDNIKRLRRRLGLKGKVVPYSYRHTYATRWVNSCGDIWALAEVMGTSVEMIEKHYGKPDAPALYRKALAFAETRAAG
jgi:integrase